MLVTVTHRMDLPEILTVATGLQRFACVCAASLSLGCHKWRRLRLLQPPCGAADRADTVKACCSLPCAAFAQAVR